MKWTAHDDNDDQLMYSVYYRGDGESRWLLLKDNVTDKAYSFDASLLPDGGYTIKVDRVGCALALSGRGADCVAREPALRSGHDCSAHRKS